MESALLVTGAEVATVALGLCEAAGGAALDELELVEAAADVLSPLGDALLPAANVALCIAALDAAALDVAALVATEPELTAPSVRPAPPVEQLMTPNASAQHQAQEDRIAQF